MASKEEKVWKECTTLQIQMKKSLKSNNNPFRKEIEELRTQLINFFCWLYMLIYIYIAWQL